MLAQGSTTTAQWLEDLSEVRLVEFTASPTSIGPFDAATLRWQVTGPAAGFRVTLNGATVPRSGEEVVQPVLTTAYNLNVNAGPYSRTLATVVVTVNTVNCELIPQPTQPIGVQLATLMRNAVLDSDSTLYFRDNPAVTFSPGRIQIGLHLGKNIADFPDASIDVTLGLGLDVSAGALVATDPTVDGSVSEPWYAYLVPGAFPILYIVLDDANEKLPVSFQPLIESIPQFLTLLYVQSQGMRYQRVTIQGDPTDAPIQITACLPDFKIGPLPGGVGVGKL